MATRDAGPVGWLKFIAGLSLIGSIIGAAVLWSNASDPVLSQDYFGETSIGEETNPFVVMMGFFVLLQGILVWATLMVFASMSENVAVIASNSDAARSRETTKQSGLP